MKRKRGKREVSGERQQERSRQPEGNHPRTTVRRRITEERRHHEKPPHQTQTCGRGAAVPDGAAVRHGLFGRRPERRQPEAGAGRGPGRTAGNGARDHRHGRPYRHHPHAGGCRVLRGSHRRGHGGHARTRKDHRLGERADAGDHGIPAREPGLAAGHWRLDRPAGHGQHGRHHQAGSRRHRVHELGHAHLHGRGSSSRSRIRRASRWCACRATWTRRPRCTARWATG